MLNVVIRRIARVVFRILAGIHADDIDKSLFNRQMGGTRVKQPEQTRHFALYSRRVRRLDAIGYIVVVAPHLHVPYPFMVDSRHYVRLASRRAVRAPWEHFPSPKAKCPNGNRRI